MTDTMTLIPNGLYRQYGVIRLAIDTERLVDLTGTVETAVTPNDTTELFAEPGTVEWVDHMVRVRNEMVGTIGNLLEETNRQSAHLEALGEALRDEATSRDWCSEYDTFAADWNLPRRSRDYEVTMTITITAPDEETAISIVADSLSLSSYSDGVQFGPEIDASEG